MRTVIYIASFIIAIVTIQFSAYGQELSADQVLSKHLDAMGTKEKRDALKSLFAAGLSDFESKVPVVQGGGKAVVISDPNNLYFLMSLNSHDYPYEKIGAFGNKISIPFINAGTRSLLGAFLNEHPKVLSESLFCGSLSLRWITDISGKAQKMKSAGLKKIGGRETYAVDLISSEQGADTFRVRLYFDAENFQHIRTEYRREVKIGRIVFGQQNQLADAKLELTEEFSNFMEIDGLTLPHQYKVTFASNSNSQMHENSWGIRVSAYYFNQKLAPGFFTFDVKD